MTNILLATATTAILAVGVAISSNDLSTRQSRYPMAPATAPDSSASDADGDRTGDGLRGEIFWPRG
jgi:hypothetical protein